MTYGIFVTIGAFATIDGSADDYVFGTEEEMRALVERWKEENSKDGLSNAEVKYEVLPLRPVIRRGERA